MKLDVLAIGAHPDDIELACGGTIIKLVKQGKNVGILDITGGELGTRGSKELRSVEAEKAGKILGLSARENMGLPDGNIEVNVENRLKIITIIRKYRPNILLIPHWLERHPDHERAHELARQAWFYSGLEKIKTEYEGKVQSPFRSKSCFHFMQAYEFVPSFVVDISDEFEQRMEAVRAFGSQFFDPNSDERETLLSSPTFLEMMGTRFRYFGDRIGVRYGEPFFSVNLVGVTDICSITS